MKWVRLKRVDLGYKDPRTGKRVNIEGRQNRPKIDPFEHIGWQYPPDMKGARPVERHEHGDDIMLLVEDGTEVGQPVSDPLRDLKEIHRFPADTTLDEQGKLIIKEKDGENTFSNPG